MKLQEVNLTSIPRTPDAITAFYVIVSIKGTTCEAFLLAWDTLQGYPEQS